MLGTHLNLSAAIPRDREFISHLPVPGQSALRVVFAKSRTNSPSSDFAEAFRETKASWTILHLNFIHEVAKSSLALSRLISFVDVLAAQPSTFLKGL